MTGAAHIRQFSPGTVKHKHAAAAPVMSYNLSVKAVCQRELTMMNHYRLIIAESLDPAWAAWLGELTLSRNKDGTTALEGEISGQNQLLRLLNKLQDLGVTLIAVELIEEGSTEFNSEVQGSKDAEKKEVHESDLKWYADKKG